MYGVWLHISYTLKKVNKGLTFISCIRAFTLTKRNFCAIIRIVINFKNFYIFQGLKNNAVEKCEDLDNLKNHKIIGGGE